MRTGAFILVAFVAACGGETATPNPMPRPIAAIERRIESPFRGVAIAPDGVYYDRKKVSSLADFVGETEGGLITALMHARAAAGPPLPHGESDPKHISMGVVVVPDSMVSPALVASVVGAVRRAGWLNISVKRIRTDPDDPNQHDLEGICDLAHNELVPPRTIDPDDERVNLSLLLTPERIWVGLSRVNEFQEIPIMSTRDHDWDKLEMTLKEHKVSAFFADRTDIEIALEGDRPVAELLATLYAACKVGFTDVAIFAAENLSARPTL